MYDSFVFCNRFLTKKRAICRVAIWATLHCHLCGRFSGASRLPRPGPGASDARQRHRSTRPVRDFGRGRRAKLFANTELTPPSHQETSRRQSPPSFGRHCVAGAPPSRNELATYCPRPPPRREPPAATAKRDSRSRAATTRPRDHMQRHGACRRHSPQTVAVQPGSASHRAPFAHGRPPASQPSADIELYCR